MGTAISKHLGFRESDFAREQDFFSKSALFFALFFTNTKTEFRDRQQVIKFWKESGS